MNCQQITIILKNYIIISIIKKLESHGMKPIFKNIFTISILLVLIVLFYFLLAYLFSFFPKITTPIPTEAKNKKVYLLYNEMHSDIVFKVQELNLSIFPEFKRKKNGYLAFGWGDKETYLNTPTWNNIKLSTSLKALFLNTPSLMHLTYYKDIFQYKNIKEIQLTQKQYKKLIGNILKSFKSNGKSYKGYGREDFFYTANGTYSLIQTCNTWTGDQLRSIGIPMSYWTPLSQNITVNLP